jgi:hypothetical protein
MSVVYKGKDLTSLVVMKTELIVAELAERQNADFDTILGQFLQSRTYENLLNPITLMWGENAAFIADEYEREIKSCFGRFEAPVDEAAIADALAPLTGEEWDLSG